MILPAAELKQLRLSPSAASTRDRMPDAVIYLGSEVSWQGPCPRLLVRAQRSAAPAGGGGSSAAIVGPRNVAWHAQLEEQVKASGLQGSVDFMDPVPRDDLPRVLSQHDVGVAPLEKSTRNVDQGGLTMKVAEYSAAGRAMIVADLPMTRRLLDERSTLFHACGRESALAQAIVTLAKDPARRVQMGASARALAAERFDGNRAGEELWTAYAQLCAFDPRRAPRSPETARAITPTLDFGYPGGASG